MKPLNFFTNIIAIIIAVVLPIFAILRFNQLPIIILVIIAFYGVIVGGYFLIELVLNLKIRRLKKQIKRLESDLFNEDNIKKV